MRVPHGPREAFGTHLILMPRQQQTFHLPTNELSS